jgi:hypothetical protein
MALSHHLAQINIARMLFPREDARMAGFFNRLDEINAMAESSPGFIWRLKDSNGNATYINAFDDESLLVNLSVWESVEALSAFTYRSAHKELISAHKQWFERSEKAYTALWWIAAGEIPMIDEAKQRLTYLQVHGPTAYAFSFKSTFAAPSSTEQAADAGAGL